MNFDIRRKSGLWCRLSEIKHAAWDVAEDRNGNMVVATWGGLCVVGHSKLCYLRKEDGLVCTEVCRVFMDRQESLWIGTLHGVTRYDGGTFLNFTSESGLAGDDVESFFEDRNGRIWIGASRGISCFAQNELRNTSLEHDGPQCRVYSICEDMNGLLWIASEAGVFTFDGTRFKKIRERGFSRKESHAVFCDSRGVLWLSWPHRGVFRYENGRLKACLVAKRPILLVNDIMEDRRGFIWFGTWEGAFCYDGKHVTEFNSHDTPGSLQPNRLYEDRANRIWFPSGVSGVLMYDPCALMKLSSDNTSNGVLMRCRSNGGFWWCNGGSLIRYVNDVCEEVAQFDSAIVSFKEDRSGRLWVVTARQRVYRSEESENVNRQKFKDFTDDVKLSGGKRFLSLAEDGRGRLWIGHDRGMFCFDGDRYEPAVWTDESGNRIQYSARIILWDKYAVCWISDGGGHGLIRYDEKKFCQLTTEDGLLHNQVGQTLMDSKGRLWVATVLGVSCYDGEIFKGYSIDDGLISGMVNHMMEDHSGQIWFATTNGIARFDGVDFQHLAEADGLPCNVINGVAEDEDGRVLIGTDQGVCLYAPDNVTRPEIVIEEVEAGGRHSSPEEVRFTAGTTVRMFFNGSCLRTKRMRYRYRLEGHDTGWISTWENEAWYENLPEGQYTFQVIAINRDMISSENPAECRLVVEKDLRDERIDNLEREVLDRTFQLEKERAIQKERARIARDLHDDLGSGLTEIGMTGERALDLEVPTDISRRYLSEIVGKTREMAESLDEIVWAASPDNDTVTSLVEYCLCYLERIMGKASIRMRLLVAENIPAASLGAGVRHQLFLAFREAVTNIIRHAGADEVYVTVEMPSGNLVITLQDNGVGMDMLRETSGCNGLLNMKHRLEEIGGICIITSVPEHGTTVRFELGLRL